MDYLGWELERQRGALTALLLGGGRTEEEEPSRDGDRRLEWEFDGVKEWETVVEEARSGNPGAWEVLTASRETVRRASRDRNGMRGKSQMVETQPSAWEGILGAEEGGADWARSGLDGEPDALAASGGGSWREARDLPDVGTGVWAEGLEALKAHGTRGELSEAVKQRAGTGGEDAGGWTPGAVSGGGKAAGDSFAVRGVGRTRQVRRTGGGAAGTQRSSFSWGGGWTAAARAEEDAKAVSRAVQRDARRYDGGFFIY